MSDAKKKAIQYYSRKDVVETYEVTRFTSLVGQVYDKLKRRIVSDLSNVNTNEVIMIDIGTGTGRFAAEFSRRRYYVIGLDISKNMILLAKNRLRNMSVSQYTDFVLADIEYMPFRQDIFDLAVCIHVLRHFRRHAKALKEVKRILKKRGKAVIDIPNAQHEKLLRFFTKKIDNRPVYDAGLTFRELSHLLSKVGFSLKEIRTTKNVPLSAFLLKRIQMKTFAKIIENIEYALSKLSLNKWFAGNFVLSCIKDRTL